MTELSASLEPALADELAWSLFEAERTASPLRPLSEGRELTLSSAYSIQRAYLKHRQASSNSVLGHKVGCTNPVIQKLFGIDTPDYGRLLDDMLVPDGGVIERAALIQPRVEPEFAFLLKESLAGPNVTAGHVLGATAGVIPCFEIIDSRIVDWQIALVDTIADNGSSARFVLGDGFVRPDRIDLRNAGCVLEHNGRIADTGAGGAVLGHPAASVAWLANELCRHGERLEAGQIVLSGALTTAPQAEAGDVFYASLSGVGTVRCSFV